MNDPFGTQITIRRNVQSAKLLLIDDNPDQCAIIQTVIQECVPEVGLLIALTQEDAFSQLRQCLATKKGLPRLILLDLYLPQADDGLFIVSQIKKADSPYRSIPLTLLSQSSRKQDIERGYDLGANSYIVKPANYDQWRLYIESLRQYWLHTVTLPPG